MTKERKHLIIYIISTIVIGFIIVGLTADIPTSDVSNYFMTTAIEKFADIVIVFIITFAKNLRLSKQYRKLFFQIDCLIIGLFLLIIPLFWFNLLGIILISIIITIFYPKLKN